MVQVLFPGMVLFAGAFPQEEVVEPLSADPEAGTVSFGARAARTEVYEQLKGAIEYLIVMPGGKEYESVFVAPVDGVKLREAMIRVGFKPGKPADEEEQKLPEGSKLRIFVEWKEGDRKRREPAEYFVLDVESQKIMDAGPWVFTGSRMAFDPAEEKMMPAVRVTKNVVSLFHNDATVLIQPGSFAKDPHQFKVHKEHQLKPGTPVRILLEPVK